MDSSEYPEYVWSLLESGVLSDAAVEALRDPVAGAAFRAIAEQEGVLALLEDCLAG